MLVHPGGLWFHNTIRYFEYTTGQEVTTDNSTIAL